MDTIETILQEAGESYGRAEQAFSGAQDNSANLQNTSAVLIENISKPEIVANPDAFADLIIPKREVYIQHKLLSFLAFDENNLEHQAILQDMLDLALHKNGEGNNTLYFNVRRKKNSDSDPKAWAIMSVAYTHLWSVQTDAMRRSDAEFRRDGKLASDLKLSDELTQRITEQVSPIQVSFESIYAPVDVMLSGASIINLFLSARSVLRIFEKDLSIALDKGVRLMARKQNSQWQLHVLTGAKLQPISKKD